MLMFDLNGEFSYDNNDPICFINACPTTTSHLIMR
jgi:hypothetical protein